MDRLPDQVATASATRSCLSDSGVAAPSGADLGLGTLEFPDPWAGSAAGSSHRQPETDGNRAARIDASRPANVVAECGGWLMVDPHGTVRRTVG